MSGYITNNDFEDGDATPRGRQSLTPMPTNLPRQVYVPPQRRGFAHPTPENRPASAMSDASFVTQGPMNGGVSLHGYTNDTRGFGQDNMSGKFHHASGSGDDPRVRGIEGGMYGNRMSMYGIGGSENRGYGGGYDDRYGGIGGSRDLSDGSSGYAGQAPCDFRQHPNQVSSTTSLLLARSLMHIYRIPPSCLPTAVDLCQTMVRLALVYQGSSTLTPWYLR